MNFYCNLTYQNLKPNLKITFNLLNCIQILSCSFINLNSLNEHGGAIYLENNEKESFINKCNFFYCGAYGYSGGACFITCKKSQFYFSCGIGCLASSRQFIAQYCPLDQQIITNFTSCSFCPNNTNSVSHSFVFDGGITLINNLNSSYNSLTGHSPGIHFNGPQSVNASYITIYSCYGQYVFIANGGYSTQSYFFHNIINNTATLKLFYCFKNHNFYNCILFNNNNNNIHYLSTGLLQLLNCIINIETSTYSFEKYFQFNCLLKNNSKLLKKEINILFLLFLLNSIII